MSRLTIDYANCLAERVGVHGIDPSQLAHAESALRTITRDLNTTRGTGWERWRDLPFERARAAHVNRIKTLVQQHRGTCRHLIVLGIGGSALGNIAVHEALRSWTWNLQAVTDGSVASPTLFVLDNADPDLIRDVLSWIRERGELDQTVINVISKSGETAETAAAFMVARALMRDALGARAGERFVAITDAEKGTMRSICDAEGYATLPVPDGVGGRFSVLSPVGLFSAAMCGIDIDQLLDGAADMDQRCANEETRQNPAALLAWLLVTFGLNGKPNHVLMPYANRLARLADWYRQLWAESLGKRHDVEGREVFSGFTPIKALGATDQHSQIQLYREGPNDKVIGFVNVTQDATALAIESDLDAPALDYLKGATVGALLRAEKRATEYALVESERPNFTHPDADHRREFNDRRVPATLDDHHRVCRAPVRHVDAFDQPAVETGKKATFGLMGRDGVRASGNHASTTACGSDRVGRVRHPADSPNPPWQVPGVRRDLTRVTTPCLHAHGPNCEPMRWTTSSMFCA